MNQLSYTLIRSNRKSIALIIDSEANLTVRAPHKTKQKEITDFIEKKSQWIADQQHQATLYSNRHQPINGKQGDRLLILGTAYTIKKIDVSLIELAGSSLLIPHDYGKPELIAWLKHKAEAVLVERISKYADIMGLEYSSIRLSEAKTQWGSCSAKNRLNFAWRLIMSPIAVIDYVVVHELSHISHKNHGAAFWENVKEVLPYYKKQQEWLKKTERLWRLFRAHYSTVLTLRTLISGSFDQIRRLYSQYCGRLRQDEYS